MWTALQIVLLLLLLTILAGVVLFVVSVVSVTRSSGQLADGVGGQANRALSGAQQAVQDVTDPNHPPTGLAYDTELTAIDTWQVGDGLPGGAAYALTLRSVERRGGADSSDTALYAVFHVELRQARETRILGQLVRSDSDAHEYVVYKGESFRLGHAVYRVNWISQETNTVAAGVVRNPDSVTQPLKFDYP